MSERSSGPSNTAANRQELEAKLERLKDDYLRLSRWAGQHAMHRRASSSGKVAKCANRQELKASAERARDLMEDLRLMPLGVSRSEAYGIVERWDEDGHIQYGRDLAEWIGPETDETAAKFTELIVLAVNMLPSLLRVLDEATA